MLALVAILGHALFQPALPVAASPDDSGWHSPSAYENNNSWVNPTYAYTSDDNRMDANSNGDTITLYNFNFSGISGTVNGIEVDVEARSSTTQPCGVRIRLMYNGRLSETDYKQTPDLTDSEAYYTLGSSTDTWGRSWTANDFTNANFAVRVIAYKPSAHHPLVDHVRVRVYYTPDWESYHTDYPPTGTQCDDFIADYQTVYMYGEGFEAGHSYHIGYYDGAGNKAVSDGTGTLTDSTLTSEWYFPNNTGSAAGDWHAVVYDDAIASPPLTYVADDANAVVEDWFYVQSGAIPEFPTVIAGIVVAGLCFGIYYWMRKRYQKQVAVA